MPTPKAPRDTRRVLVERIRMVARRYDLPFAAVEELVEAVADLFGVCPDCGRSFERENPQQVYCPEDAAIRTREANRLSQQKRRARLKPEIDILELTAGQPADDDPPAAPHRVK